MRKCESTSLGMVVQAVASYAWSHCVDTRTVLATLNRVAYWEGVPDRVSVIERKLFELTDGLFPDCPTTNEIGVILTDFTAAYLRIMQPKPTL